MNSSSIMAVITVSTLGFVLFGNTSVLSADLPPRTFETIPEGESGAIDETVALGKVLQNKRVLADKTQNGKLLRGVHAKAHGCVKAKFTVNSNLPQHFQTGLFAKPGQSYDAWIRFSNASVLREDDLKPNAQGTRTNGSRGMAIKVLGVEGNMLESDKGQSNQDFLMINTPEFAFSNVRDYLRLNRLLTLSEKGDAAAPFFLPIAIAALGEPKDDEPSEVTAKRKALIGKMQALPPFKDFSPADLGRTAATIKLVKGSIETRVVRNPVQVQYFGAAPFLFGNQRTMKFSAAPCQRVDQKAFENISQSNPSKNYLRQALNLTMKGTEALCYNFKIQVRDIDQKDLNIENANSKWPGEENNYVDVARITIDAPQQTQTKEAHDQCEALAFSPWHGLSVHRPLGGINRLRRKVYIGSATHREADIYK